eukprot:3204630-Amphidinium_carterae.1
MAKTSPQGDVIEPKARSLPQPEQKSDAEGVAVYLFTTNQTHLVCRAARAKEGPHYGILRLELSERPLQVQIDYVFESRGDSTSTVLTMTRPVSGWCNAIVVLAKGPVAWVVEWILLSLRSAGIQRFLFSRP